MKESYIKFTFTDSGVDFEGHEVSRENMMKSLMILAHKMGEELPYELVVALVRGGLDDETFRRFVRAGS